MNRRKFGLLAGTSAVALGGMNRPSHAQSADPAQLLSTTLTPFGAERAGNADGSIPVWTGGFSEVPADWNPDADLLPDFFAADPVLYTVDSSNIETYAGKISGGVRTLIQKQGMSLKVYQTRRTACAPQWVYDNIVANTKTAALNPAGGRLGFSGAYGGTPFPIPDTSDPLAAGAQIMWNHVQRWNGLGYRLYNISYSVEHGNRLISGVSIDQYYFPYYDPKGSLANYAGQNQLTHEILLGPSTVVGEQIITHYYSNPLATPNITWEVLQGQGRVRKAPEVAYDTPSNFADDIANYDEYNGFSGALNEYDWKLIGKQELFLPYNCNALRRAAPDIAVGPKFLNPDVVRWELHRVWVVEGTLHPGSRNVLARRRYYIDEDTWIISQADCYDGTGNIYHFDVNYMAAFPNMPGVFPMTNITYNLQTGDYTVLQGVWNAPPSNRPVYFGNFPNSTFDPQVMAAAASY